jgi:hypothetical protein
MKIHEERTPTISGGAVTQTTESARQVEETDLFLNHLRADLRMRLIPGEPTPRQRTRRKSTFQRCLRCLIRMPARGTEVIPVSPL